LPALTNRKWELFAQELAKGKAQADAYALAGFKRDDGHAARLAGDGRIKARVADILGQAAAKTGVEVETVLRELVAVGTADIGRAVEWNGEKVTLKDSASLPAEVRAAISEVRQTRDGVAIKFHSKTAALDMLGRHLGMFKERLEHSGPGGEPIETRELDPLDFARRIMFALERGRRALDRK
jgi:phage terminase small subunit